MYMYIKGFKWSYHIMGEAIPRLDTMISCYQIKTPVIEMGCTFLSHGPKGFVSPSLPQLYRILPVLLVFTHNLVIRSGCWRYHLLIPYNMEKFSWHSTEASPLQASVHRARRYNNAIEGGRYHPQLHTC